jgi:hypothetical protein
LGFTTPVFFPVGAYPRGVSVIVSLTVDFLLWLPDAHPGRGGSFVVKKGRPYRAASIQNDRSA